MELLQKEILEQEIAAYYGAAGAREYHSSKYFSKRFWNAS